MRPVLTDVQAKFLREEKEALAGIRVALTGLDLPRPALDTLQQAILQLDELFLLVVVGEFNAGKSALLNALLGEKVLAEGVTPTTSRVTLVKWRPVSAAAVWLTPRTAMPPNHWGAACDWLQSLCPSCQVISIS